MSLVSTTTIKLNTGADMPAIGLGLWNSTADAGVAEAITAAFKNGYRMLDGAAAYGNEKDVGAAVKECIDNGIVKRDEIFLVSKIFQTHHVWKDDRSRVALACEQTLADLQVEYLDLYLMHWPFTFQQTEVQSIGGLRLADGTPNPKLVLEMEYMDTWDEMVKLYKAGKVKAIGVSNFTVKQLQDIIDGPSGVVPAVNQCELHPYLQQRELRDFCTQHGIKMMAYSPLGAGASYSGTSFPQVGTGPFESPHGGTTLMQNPMLKTIADKLGKSQAQVLIRWSHQSGLICIPKSVTPERIAQNAAVLDWEIPEEDMATIAKLDCGFRYGIGYGPGHFDCPNAPWYNK